MLASVIRNWIIDSS